MVRRWANNATHEFRVGLLEHNNLDNADCSIVLCFYTLYEWRRWQRCHPHTMLGLFTHQLVQHKSQIIMEELFLLYHNKERPIYSCYQPYRRRWALWTMPLSPLSLSSIQEWQISIPFNAPSTSIESWFAIHFFCNFFFCSRTHRRRRKIRWQLP